MKITIHKITVADMKSLISVHFCGRFNNNEIETLLQFGSRSVPLVAAMYGDDLLCIFGLLAPTLMSSEAYIWVQVTDAVDHHKIAFARYSRKLTQMLLEIYPKITGHCFDEPSCDWLRFCGAKIKSPVGAAIPFEIT